MKKNVMMRVASIMLVLVLMSSSVISGTFAKYVTSGESTDTARVAHFGVEVTANFSNLFKSEYNTSVAWTGDDGVSVKSIMGGDVVAPGTTGSLADFVVTGTPEVDVVVTYTPTLTMTGWDADGDEYCPIIFNVNDELFYIDNTNINSVNELVTAVQNAIIDSTAKYNAGTDLSTVVADDLEVSWLWQFDNNVTGFKNADGQTDDLDTVLGNWYKNGKAAPTITLDVKCTVTQID